MQFSIGDKVMHPQYGPGQIIDVQDRELVEGFEHYYVVELLKDESVLFVPKRKTDELGVRPVMSQAKLARVLTVLREVPRRLSKDFKVRQARVREKLATARPTQVAEAVRDLTGRRQSSHLTTVDTRLLKRGRELLASEIAAVNGTDVMYAQHTIDAALKSGAARDSDTALKGDAARDSDPAKPARVIGADLTPERQTLVQKLLRQVKE